jgi:hypothetical protein
MKKEFESHRRAYRLRLQRIRRLLKPLPRRANIRRYPVIRWFAEAAHRRPWLWSFKMAHVAPALYIGAVVGLLPMPGQLLLGFIGALLLHANLPVIAALCFASNPLTMVPLFTACYATGHWALHLISPDSPQYRLAEGLAAMTHGDFSGAGDVLVATFLGAVLVGLAAGAVMHVLWRVGAWEAGQFRDKLVRLRKAAHRVPEAVVEPVPPAPAAKSDEPDGG